MNYKELLELFNICVKEVSEKSINDLKLKGWVIQVNGRLSRTLGRTDFDTKKIEMQKKFVQYGTKEEIKDTILHEIAHVLAGIEHKHDKVWQEIAESLGAIPEAGKTVSIGVLRNDKKKNNDDKLKNGKYTYVVINGLKFKVLSKNLENIRAIQEKNGIKIKEL